CLIMGGKSDDKDKTIKEALTDTLVQSITRLSEENGDVDAEIRRLSSFLSGQYTSKFANEFTVSEILGIGGGGCVFKTVNKLDEANYAVKRIAVDKERENMKKTLREVRAMAQLDHPGIVRYNSTWIEEPPVEWQYHADEETLERIKSKKRQLMQYNANSVFIYIQMQLCKYSLAEWLDKEDSMNVASRNLPRMKMWFKQIVAAVEYIHDKNLIHRDLKPGNILFVENDRVKICDMGIVTEKKVEDGMEVTMTQTGSGTPEYMSPEQQALFSQLSTKSDIFTLGLILAELCVPMNYDKKAKIFENFRRGKPNNIFSDERTAAFVSLLTDVDRKKRPTCRKMLDD
ncbi:hypothetical protein PMAYCL1PPCAC_08428, partial [Pristionchus mayeri]